MATRRPVSQSTASCTTLRLPRPTREPSSNRFASLRGTHLLGYRIRIADVWGRFALKRVASSCISLAKLPPTTVNEFM